MAPAASAIGTLLTCQHAGTRYRAELLGLTRLLVEDDFERGGALLTLVTVFAGPRGRRRSSSVFHLAPLVSPFPMPRRFQPERRPVSACWRLAVRSLVGANQAHTFELRLGSVDVDRPLVGHVHQRTRSKAPRRGGR